MATVKLDPAKGVQIPNMTTTERNAVSDPETGALVWNTTTSAVNQYNGSAWKEMLRSDGSAASLTAIPAANITGTLPAISGANLTGVGVDGIVSSADATAMTITSAEKIGIGTTSPTAKLEINRDGAALGTGWASNTALALISADAYLDIVSDDSGAGGSSISLKQVDGTTFENAWNIYRKTNGDGTGDGSLRFAYGTNAGAVQNTDMVTILSDGKVGIKQSNPSRELDVFGALHAGADSGGGAGNGGGVTIGEALTMSGDSCYITRAGSGWMDFSGRPNSALYGMRFYVAGAEKIRFQPGGGISFGGDTATANALDDYEEGTYQPTFAGTSGGSWSTAAYTYLEYVKIGKLVHIQGYLNIGSESSPSGNIIMSLPFTPTFAAQDSGNSPAVISMRGHSGSGLYNMTGSIATSGMQIVSVSAGGSGNWIDSGDIGSSFNIRISATYHAS